MNCSKIMDTVYEYYDNEEALGYSMPIFAQIQIWLHSFFCPSCANEIEKLEKTKSILNEDFFCVSPGTENFIMAKIQTEEELYEKTDDYAPAGFSTRGWVLAGLVIFISLATAFFGLDFKQVTNETGASFILPMGILTGIVLTTYGVLFIGSHLKELTERFGL